MKYTPEDVHEAASHTLAHGIDIDADAALGEFLQQQRPQANPHLTKPFMKRVQQAARELRAQATGRARGCPTEGEAKTSISSTGESPSPRPSRATRTVSSARSSSTATKSAPISMRSRKTPPSSARSRCNTALPST